MQLVDGRWVDEKNPVLARPELIESGGPERVLVSPSRWLVVALVLALVGLAVLGGYAYVDHQPTVQERAAIQVVGAFYAALDAHDERAVMATMTSNGTHLGNGALGGDVLPIGGETLRAYLRALFSSGDFTAALTEPASVSADQQAILVTVPNRLSAMLPDGRPVAVTGVSVLSLVTVDGRLKVDRHTWQEQGSLGWSRWAGAAVTPVRVCPANAAPDRPGSATQARPALSSVGESWMLVPPPVAMDSQLGQLLAVGSNGTWAFDVCTNSWTRVQTAEQSPGYVQMTYDAYTHQNVGLDWPNPWVYEGSWITLPRTTGVTDPTSRTVRSVTYDPVSGQILFHDGAGDLWAYTTATNTVTPVDVGDADAPVNPSPLAAELLSYDPVSDQLVLVQLSADSPAEGQTWTFNGQTRTWTQRATPPTLTTDSAVTYDTSAERFLVFSRGTLATYDPATDTWSRIAPGPGWPSLLNPLTRTGAALVYDPVNQRDLLVGGNTNTGPADDIWAYTLTADTWTQLLSSPTRGSPQGPAGSAEDAAMAAVMRAYAAFNSGNAQKWVEIRDAGSYYESDADRIAAQASAVTQTQEAINHGAQYTQITCTSHGPGQWSGIAHEGLPVAVGLNITCTTVLTPQTVIGSGPQSFEWVVANGVVVAVTSNP